MATIQTLDEVRRDRCPICGKTLGSETDLCKISGDRLVHRACRDGKAAPLREAP